MEALSPIPLTYDQLLTPFAEVMAAEGFTVETLTPFEEAGLDAAWCPTEGEVYMLALQHEEGQLQCMLAHKKGAKPHKMLFDWTRVDSPEELQWLLRRCARLAEAMKAASPIAAG